MGISLWWVTIYWTQSFFSLFLISLSFSWFVLPLICVPLSQTTSFHPSYLFSFSFKESRGKVCYISQVADYFAHQLASISYGPPAVIIYNHRLQGSRELCMKWEVCVNVCVCVCLGELSPHYHNSLLKLILLSSSPQMIFPKKSLFFSLSPDHQSSLASTSWEHRTTLASHNT